MLRVSDIDSFVVMLKANSASVKKESMSDTHLVQFAHACFGG